MQLWAWFTDPAHWTGPNGIPARTWEQVVMSLLAMGIALVLALPVAVLLGHRRRGVLLATNVSNVGRAVPTLAVLIILASIPSIGVGDTAAVLALALFAIPPLVTNTFAGITSVDREVLDAARGMGMTAGQLLARVELPLAAPLIVAGIRTAAVQVVATASLAALVGGGGLGRYVVDGFALQDTTVILAGAILTAGLAVLAEGLFAALERVTTPRGLRSRSAHVAPIADVLT
ncbi:MAG: ABC transporter permease [Candidatus Nanopelagicales bacterium]|jgi:osmoprotectant transport system permease protein|nr:ABC transporter permease [Candidatus Nanopelagicales bacterium]